MYLSAGSSMKKKVWFHFLYSMRHIIAFLCAMLGFIIIKQVALLIYVKPYQPLDAFTFYRMLWSSSSLFLHIILLFNIFIKPLFIYFIVLFIFFILK
ncbi:hypothetical protein A6J40_15195 [Legionella longbeachae]|uniref:Uncharacterized protein n=1 Tax=Legionella longbeachae serogroup 1 (strain NSW150) TaxID=661367 RepID=D3HL59_LEGLN|nr:hypothetical protein A6J40_15195 [Legionella longbeachae]EEZ93687.1 conserved hypothetical protein [Legionella longbeachae D-4968]CBJ13178.1 hypothetical protein LLO_2747 [Legionella longbeachae NSW150]ARM33462.1 hypothetical protein B0B39_07950 [Legionella longbeachae]QIN33385.1 hypothetical protein GCB94_15120 [Legionella longbeachae]